MTDLEYLYVLLAAFYLWECSCWVRRGGVAFIRWWRPSSRPVQPSANFGNARGGIVFAPPLPFEPAFIAAQFPVSPGEAGVLAFTSANVNPGPRPPQSGRFVRWEEIRTAAARGKAVEINGARFAQAQSSFHARWLAGELRALSQLSPAQRPRAIRALIEGGFDADAVRRRIGEYEAETRWFPWLAGALFGLVFAAAPAVIWQHGIERTWLPLAGGLFLLLGTTTFLFHRAHRKLHPEAKDERFSQVLMISMFAPAAMRAADLLARPLLERFHPLAVASARCDPDTLRRFAAPVLRDLRNPALPRGGEGNPEAAAAEEEARAMQLAAAAALLARAGLKADDLAGAPKRAEAGCPAYCPRCHAQFTATGLRCADCGGLPLAAF